MKSFYREGSLKPRALMGGLFLFFSLGTLFPTEVVVINRLESPLYEVYAIAEGKSGWGEDRLPYDVILPGEFGSIFISSSEEELYNLRFIDEEGDSYYKYGINLKERKKIVVTPGDHEFLTSSSNISFTIVNQTGAALKGLYISPPQENNWGGNYLETFLPLGGELTLNFKAPGFYDIRYEGTTESVILKRVYITHKARILLSGQ